MGALQIDETARPRFDRRRWSDLDLNRWIVITAFVMLVLPAISRVDVGWDPAVAPTRRLAVLAIGVVVTTAYLARWRAARWLVTCSGVLVLAVAGWRGVALTFALSIAFAEAVRGRLGTDPGRTVDTQLDGVALRTALVIASALVAVMAQLRSQLPVTTVQSVLVAVAVIRGSLIELFGALVLRVVARLRAPPWRVVSEPSAAPEVRSEPTAGWRQFPTGVAERVARSDPFVTGTSLAVAFSVLLAVIASSDSVLPEDPRIVITVVAASLAVGLATTRPAADRCLVDVVAASALAVAGFRWGALALVLVVAAIESGARELLDPRSSDRERTRSATSAVLLLGASSLLVSRLIGPPAGIATLCLAAGICWHRPSVTSVLGDLGQRLVAAIRRGLTVVGAGLTAAAGCLVVLVPHGIERFVGWDPTATPRVDGTRFVARHVQSTDDRRTWIPRTNLTRSPRTTAMVVARSALLLVVVTGLLGGLLHVRSTGNDVGGPPSAALANSPWWAAAARVQTLTFERGQPTAFAGMRLRDVRSPDTNVVDGRRVTWQPSVAPRLRVWLFGGSTAFGLGQRDEHTIASELAKDAAAAGIPIEVTNFGVHGDVRWNENQRLREALASTREAPDLVVFYDGWNDLMSHTLANLNGPGAGQVFRGALDPILGARRDGGFPPLEWIFPEPDELAATTTTTITQEDALDASIRQFRVAVEDGRALLAAQGIPSVDFLQPTSATRSRPIPGESPAEADFKDLTQRFRTQRPPGVIDLGGVMDGTGEPVYFDSGHTNELGADIVAGAMLDELLPTLRRLDTGG